jgi:hypothetical protein
MSKLGSFVAFFRSVPVDIGPITVRLYWGKRGPSLNIRKKER